MKNIMVMGAGIYQLPLIKKVKEMGHTAIVVSPIGKYPGIGFADLFIEADTRDKHTVLEKAREHNIDAILTTGTDVAVPTIGYVNDHLNLSGVRFEAAKKSMGEYS